MSEVSATPSEASIPAQYAEGSHHVNYTRIYLILLVLLGISIAGPMLEIRVVTLVTAFGIAVVKAYLVVKNFMHIDVAKRYVAYLMVTCLVFMLLLFAGAAPDVMEADGSNWEKPAWVDGGFQHATAGAGHHGEAGAHGGEGHGGGH